MSYWIKLFTINEIFVLAVISALFGLWLIAACWLLVDLVAMGIVWRIKVDRHNMDRAGGDKEDR